MVYKSCVQNNQHIIKVHMVIFEVGACIVLKEPRRAISVGYNGLPNGRDRYTICDKPEDYGMIVYYIYSDT